MLVPRFVFSIRVKELQRGRVGNVGCNITRTAALGQAADVHGQMKKLRRRPEFEGVVASVRVSVVDTQQVSRAMDWYPSVPWRIFVPFHSGTSHYSTGSDFCQAPNRIGRRNEKARPFGGRALFPTRIRRNVPRSELHDIEDVGRKRTIRHSRSVESERMRMECVPVMVFGATGEEGAVVGGETAGISP